MIWHGRSLTALSRLTYPFHSISWSFPADLNPTPARRLHNQSLWEYPSAFGPVNEFSAKTGWSGGVLFARESTWHRVWQLIHRVRLKRQTIEDSIQHPRVFWFFLDVPEQWVGCVTPHRFGSLSRNLRALQVDEIFRQPNSSVEILELLRLEILCSSIPRNTAEWIIL